MNMTPVPYDQYLDMDRESLPNYRELMGARYLVAERRRNPARIRTHCFSRTDSTSVYRLANSMPLTVLVHELSGYYSDAAQFYSRINLGFDYNRTAYVSQLDLIMLALSFVNVRPSPKTSPILFNREI